MGDKAAENRERSKALDLLNVGNYKEAEPLLRAIFEQVKAQKDVESFMWGRRVAEALVRQGKFAEAEPFAQAAAKGFEGKYGSEDEDTLDCKYILAESLNGQKKYLTASPLAQSALTGLEANLKRGPEHCTTLLCKTLVAVIMHGEGQYADAKSFAQSAFEAWQAADTKAETLASQGSRRLSTVELLGMQYVQNVLEAKFNLLNENKDENREGSKVTVSTHAPESEATYSRQTSIT